VLPVKEDFGSSPLSPYAASKLAAEGYCRAFASSYGLDTLCLRCFNVYGPGQTAGPYSGVISRFATRILNGRRPLIYGDGTQTRDFVFVGDVVHAMNLCLKGNYGKGEVFNIGTGRGTTINELAQTMCRLTKREDLALLHKPEVKGEIKHSFADTTKAERILGFRPKIGLRKGLAVTLEWTRGAPMQVAFRLSS
jgi:nucleoside-diphosphate-sugar epimerase